MARFLVLAGLSLVALGAIVWVAGRLGLPKLGQLPGDFVYRGQKVTLYFPLGTCVLVSAVITLLAMLFGRR
ncbi:MAG: DUF2905 domain-containing protein [Bryobacterales bacterium]|nr:DUF2905 domain-containing protein [Bryobacterales bacterium]